MKTKLISSLKIIGMELLGSILIAVGIYNFAAASAFPMTGFSGIALIFNRAVLHCPGRPHNHCPECSGSGAVLQTPGQTVLSAFRALYGHLINYDRLSWPPCSRYTPEAGCWRQSARACWPGWAMPLSICRIPPQEAPTLS